MTEINERLKSFIERIERLEEEKSAIAADIKEVYAEAKGTGFDPKIMRMAIRLRKMEPADRAEQEELLDLYKAALGMLAGTPLGDSALSSRMSPTPHDPKTGEVIDDGNSDVTGLAERLHRLAANGDTDALQVIAAAKYGPDVMRAVAAGILDRDEHTNAATSGGPDIEAGTDVAAPESCGGVEGDHALNGHAADRCDGTELAGLHPTIQFEGNGKACATGTRDDAHPETKPLAFRHEADEPGPQDTPTKPSRASTTVAFIPDPSLPRVKNVGHVDDIPAFLKRANSGQVGRA